PPRSTLFPYTTLFRSNGVGAAHGRDAVAQAVAPPNVAFRAGALLRAQPCVELGQLLRRADVVPEPVVAFAAQLPCAHRALVDGPQLEAMVGFAGDEFGAIHADVAEGELLAAAVLI